MMLPLAEIEPVITNFLYAYLLSDNRIASPLKYMLSPSDKLISFKSQSCQSLLFNLYCIVFKSLPSFGYPSCVSFTVDCPCDVKHRFWFWLIRIYYCPICWYVSRCIIICSFNILDKCTNW